LKFVCSGNVLSAVPPTYGGLKSQQIHDGGYQSGKPSRDVV